MEKLGGKSEGSCGATWREGWVRLSCVAWSRGLCGEVQGQLTLSSCLVDREWGED